MQGPFRVDTASSVEEAMAKLEKERARAKQIKAHLDILNEACIESAEEK
jgi:hypothetical protein